MYKLSVELLKQNLDERLKISTTKDEKMFDKAFEEIENIFLQS
jgi:hypothetical protein